MAESLHLCSFCGRAIGFDHRLRRWMHPADHSQACVDPGVLDLAAVFAYGSLRPGASLGLWAEIAADVDHTERATLHGWQLRGAGRAYPTVVESGDPVSAVRGDVLYFSRAAWIPSLSRMIAMEGVPHLYRVTTVAVESDDHHLSTVALFVPVDLGWALDMTRIDSGDWFDEPRSRASRSMT